MTSSCILPCFSQNSVYCSSNPDHKANSVNTELDEFVRMCPDSNNALDWVKKNPMYVPFAEELKLTDSEAAPVVVHQMTNRTASDLVESILPPSQFLIPARTLMLKHTQPYAST